MPGFTELKERHRVERESQSQYLTVRIHRALSWLQRAELSDDQDSKFIFPWIAFNAAYACEIKVSRPFEQEMFNAFISRLHGLDDKERLDKITWEQFSQSIRILLSNKFIFQPFWDFQNAKIPEKQWLASFESAKGVVAKGVVAKAIGAGDTPRVLSVVFSRLYTLRNQLIHGGATWNSGVNRDQIRECSSIMRSLVPVILEIMMDSPNELWGQPCYPVTD